MLTEILNSPIPIRSPLPWALGRLWFLKGKGIIHVRGPHIERIYLLHEGDVAGVWHRADDELVHDNEKLRLFFSFQPNYMELPYHQCAPLMLTNLNDLREQIGWAFWRRHIKKALLDVLDRDITHRVWWPFPSTFKAGNMPTLSIPEVLWEYALGCGPVHIQFLKSLDIPEILYHTLYQTLLNDSRVPLTFRRTVLEPMRFLPGHAPEPDNEKIFLSFFYIPPKKITEKTQPVETQPTPSSQPELKDRSSEVKETSTENHPELPEQEETVRLEDYIDRWDYLSAFSYQSERWSHYRVLGVPQDADEETIRNRFRTLSRIFHPDRWHDADSRKYEIVSRLFDRIRKAYEILSDEDQRRIYDHELKSQQKRVEIVDKKEGYIDPKLYQEYVTRALKFVRSGKYQEAARWLISSERIHSSPHLKAAIAYMKSFDNQNRHESMKQFETLTNEGKPDGLILWMFADALTRWGFQNRAKKISSSLSNIDPRVLQSLGEPGKLPPCNNRSLLNMLRDVLIVEFIE